MELILNIIQVELQFYSCINSDLFCLLFRGFLNRSSSLKLLMIKNVASLMIKHSLPSLRKLRDNLIKVLRKAAHKCIGYRQTIVLVSFVNCLYDTLCVACVLSRAYIYASV